MGIYSGEGIRDEFSDSEVMLQRLYRFRENAESEIGQHSVTETQGTWNFSDFLMPFVTTKKGIGEVQEDAETVEDARI